MLSIQLQAYPSHPFSRSPMFTLASAVRNRRT